MKKNEIIEQIKHNDFEFDGKNIGKVKLTKMFLDDSTFRDAELVETNFTKSSLRECSFEGSYLKNVNFENCDLSWTSFKKSYLNGVKFYFADLCRTNFFKANISNTDLWISYFRSFDVFATTKHLQIGCEIHSWDKWLDNKMRRQIAEDNDYEDYSDFTEFFKVCRAAKKMLDKRFG